MDKNGYALHLCVTIFLYPRERKHLDCPGETKAPQLRKLKRKQAKMCQHLHNKSGTHTSCHNPETMNDFTAFFVSLPEAAAVLQQVMYF